MLSADWFAPATGAGGYSGSYWMFFTAARRRRI
jgi:hypothetical protein